MGVRIRPGRPKSETQAAEIKGKEKESYDIIVPVGTEINIEYED